LESAKTRALRVASTVACIMPSVYHALCLSSSLSIMPIVCDALMSIMPSIYLHAKFHTRIKNLVNMSIP